MADGPLGGPRPFTKDKRTVLVLIGIDGPEPPNDIQLSLQESINTTVNQALIDKGADIDIARQTVNLTVEGNPTAEQRQSLGPATLHVQQFDVKTELSEVSQGLVNAIHNTVVDQVKELGFNVTGSRTTIS